METEETQIESLAKALWQAARETGQRFPEWNNLEDRLQELYRQRAQWLIKDGWTHHDYVESK